MSKRIGTLLAWALMIAASAWSQQTVNNVPALLIAYPDLIVHNAMIYSMDDAGFNTSTGRTYQAMAVRGDTIQFLGTNDETLRLAG
ncbi:MAG TPA: hypothetical protein VIC04_04595, partial [Terriglobia bacterium]